MKKTETIHFRITKKEKEFIQKKSHEQGKTISQFITDILYEDDCFKENKEWTQITSN